MWVLSVDAGTLLSVVQFDPKKAPKMAKEHLVDDGGDYLLVRARVKQSLGYVADVLEAIYKGEVPDWTKPIIADDKTADYRFRMVIAREEWKRYLLFEADGIDYSSHVKEETVKRQPEPKIGNLYSALSATWTAWSKLQPTPPYGGVIGSWSSKPDCKNCSHAEVRHTVKGDKCNGVWNAASKKTVPCDCTKYEPKPVPVVWRDCECNHTERQHKYTELGKDEFGTMLHDEACTVKGCSCEKYTQKPAPAPSAAGTVTKSAEESAGVFSEAGTNAYSPAYPASVYGSDWDVPVEEWQANAAYDSASDTWHADWCVFWDGDACICGEQDTPLSAYDGPITVTKPAVLEEDEIVVDGGLVINGKLVLQEPAVPGETPQQRKNRVARNRRARRRARKAAVATK